jgi:hypothetical protein
MWIATSQSSKISSLAMRTRTPSTPGKLHQALAQLADERLQQIDVLGSALLDDDGAHAAVVQHVHQVIVAGQQGLAAMFSSASTMIGCGAVFS